MFIEKKCLYDFVIIIFESTQTVSQEWLCVQFEVLGIEKESELCMYVCMYVYMYVCMYVCIYVFYVRMYLWKMYLEMPVF